MFPVGILNLANLQHVAPQYPCVWTMQGDGAQMMHSWPRQGENRACLWTGNLWVPCHSELWDVARFGGGDRLVKGRQRACRIVSWTWKMVKVHSFTSSLSADVGHSCHCSCVCSSKPLPCVGPAFCWILLFQATIMMVVTSLLRFLRLP